MVCMGVGRSVPGKCLDNTLAVKTEIMSSSWNQVTRKPHLLSETGEKRDLQSLIQPQTSRDGGLSKAVQIAPELP